PRAFPVISTAYTSRPKGTYSPAAALCNATLGAGRMRAARGSCQMSDEWAPPQDLGRGLKSCPEQDSDELNGGKEVGGVLFEACGDAAGMFELVEEALD